jgi:hypothetical protein
MSRHLKITSLALCGLVLTVSVAGCPGGEEPRDPCEGVVCGAGHCVAHGEQAACECDSGYHPEGLTCVKDGQPPRNPCDPNPCMPPRGQCSNVDGGAVCGCDPGTQEGDGGVCFTPTPCNPNPCTTPNKTDCSVSGGLPVCSCVPGYVPEGEGCKPEPTVTCAGEHTTGDSFEPDECPALARAIGTSGAQNEPHTLSPAGDEDWFKIAGAAGHLYEISAAGAAGVRLDVDLYAADGTTVLASDHSGLETVGLIHKAAAAGDLFVRVRAFGGGAGGGYSISIGDLGVDDFADEPALATVLTAPSGTPASGAFQFGGDRDVVKIPLSAGRSYRFEAAWAAALSTSALRLELIAPDRTTVVVSSEQVAPRVLTRITSSGDYYLRLQEPTKRVRAGYTFTFTDLGVDDHGDSPSESSPVVIGAPPASGGLERPGDADVFSFNALAGHIYAFTCNPTGGAADCLVSLSDEAGAVLATDTNGGTGYIVYEYAQAGTYYFRVSSGAVGTYTYRLEDLGLDDHGDTRAMATAVTSVATPTGAKLEVPGDVDFLKFDAEADRIYSFTCTAAAFKCAVELQDATGAVLASGTATGDSLKLTHTFTAAGTAYVRIVSEPTGGTGPYTWLLESEHVDDHGDTIDTATPITPGGGVVTGSLEELGDVNVFRFSATAGHIYRFTCSRSTYDCDAELLDASGAVLVSATGPETTAVITYEFNVGGSYYFRVRTDAAATGMYGYSLEDLGVDDHGDTSADATALAAGASGTGKLELAGDVDVFSFSGLAEEVWEFTCTGTSVDCNVLLVDSAGTTVASDTGASANAKVTYRLPRAGTWFLHVKSTPAATGSYGYQLRNLGTDEHGDTPGTATPVVVGAPPAGGRVDTPGDVDFFSFDALAGHIYEITCTSAALSCELRLMNATGTVLASDSGANAKVLYEIGSAGTYYFRLSGAAGATGTYTYRIVDLGLDDHGDDRATATAITAGAPAANGTLEIPGDLDVFSFTALASHLYEFTCTGTSIDCNIELLNASGAVVVSDTRPSASAKVRVQLVTPGTYYVRVSGGASGSAMGTYTYQLQDLGLDDHGNGPDTSTPVPPGAPPANGRIDGPGDVDVFSFEPVAGHIYRFTCSTAAFDCDATLVDVTGAVLASDTTSSTNAVITYEFNAAGTYYFKVYSANGNLGSYTYKLEDLGVDDHGDTVATATSIAPSATGTPGRIEYPGDWDVFSFSAEAGHIYELTCTGSDGDCDLDLVDAAGTLLAQDIAPSSSARILHELGTAGTYFVKLRYGNALSTTMGNYTYQLKDLGLDDHGDTQATATLITPSATGSPGRVETVGDLDYFSFAGSMNTTYEFSCTSSDFDCNVVLYDAFGVVLLSDTRTTFSAKVTYVVRTAGTFYVRVYSGAATLGSYTYQLKDLGTDDHGNTLDNATPVTPSTTFANARIDSSADVDVFSFTALAGHIYEVECTSSDFDCNLVLMDSVGVTIASDTRTTFSARVRAELAAEGIYYFRIEPGTASFGNYSYRVRDLGVDDHGDTVATATPITPSATGSPAQVETVGDLDYFSFAGSANTTYEFSCTSSDFDCNVVLYDGSGTVLLSDTRTTFSAKVTYVVRTVGTFYVRVYSGAATFGAYTYQLKDLGTDDHGNTLDNATPVTPSTIFANARIDSAADVDMFSFTALAGHIYEVECTSSDFDCNVVLMDSVGTTLASDTRTTFSARVRAELSVAGIYYFRIQPGTASFGNYSYRVRDLGVDDHGDTVATATVIAPMAASAPGQIETNGDWDVFAFNATAGHIYEFACTGSDGDCDLDLVDAAGTLLAQDIAPSSSARVLYEIGLAGTYYVKLRFGNASSTVEGNYSYQLKDLGVDDHGDTQATATLITPSATGSPGRVETVGDLDYFRFAGAVNTAYEFSCTSSDFDCNVALYDSTGAMLLSDTSTSFSAKVTYVVRTAGTFYVRVYSGAATLGNYTYQLKNLGADDHGNTPDNATPVTPSTTLANARIDSAADVDVFSFVALAGHIYEVECNSTAFDCNLVLLDSAGATVASDTGASFNARVRAELNTAGTYYFRIQPGTASFGNYTYRVRDLGVDDHGDTLATATLITPMAAGVTGQIETVGDWDVFAFNATAGHIYDFTCTGAAGDCDLDLVDAAGTLLAQDTGSSSSARILYEIGPAGTYYLKLRFGNSSATVIGNYTYQLKDLGVDDHGDTQATATLITPSATSSTGRIETVGDLDYLSFAATANTTYEFSCSSAAIDCNVVLYDASGTVVLSDTGSSSSAKVTYLVRTAGTFYLRVYSGNSTIGDDTYQLKNLGLDDHGNTLADATPVTPSSTFANARIDAAADVDVFSFVALAGHIYEVECTTTAFDCDLVLMDAAGTTIVSDTAGSFNAVVRAELSVGGTYYFRVQPGTASFGNYSYRVRDLGVDDHGDTLATATPITVSPTAATGNFETSGDVDWFSFTAEAGHIYEFSCSGLTCRSELYYASGSLMNDDSSSGITGRVLQEISVAGTYYLKVRPHTSTSIGSYTYQLKDLGLDDHGDTLATATPITVSPTTTTANFETNGDADWFSFSAEAGHIYEFTCSGVTCRSELYSAAGVLLADDFSTETTGKLLYEIGAAGTYYLRAKANSTSGRGSYTYQLKDVGVDDHGDTLATATPITVSSTTTTANFETNGDVDWFSFTAEAGHIYEFTCLGLTCRSELYNAAGSLVNDDSSSGITGKILHEMGAAGIYYLKVRPHTSSSRGSYTWQLKDLGLDDHGDTLATATPITVSPTAATANFETNGDADWFSFSAEAGHIYEFTCSGVTCRSELYSAAGVLLADDFSTGTTGKLLYEIGAAGTYYLRAKAHSTSGRGSYTWQLKDVGVDDHGDTLATATSITVSPTAISGQFETNGDPDWFSFSAEAGHIYEFTCVGTNCRANLYNAAGTLMIDDSTSTSTWGKIVYEFTTAGTYFLRANPDSLSSTRRGSYTYQLKELGVDDHGDTRATATPITVSPTSATGQFETLGDEDWFTFSAEAGHVYDFTCVGLTCRATLYDAAGTLVIDDTTSTNTSGRIVHELNAAGTYYLRVRANSSSSRGSYTYQLKDMGVDDHGDTQATATSITPSASFASGVTETGSDADWFAFTAAAGQAFDFICNTTNFDCDLFLYNAAGTLLVQDTGGALNAQVTYKFTTAGTYYVKLVSGTGVFGAYSYRLNDRGVDDHSDTTAGATPLTLGVGTAGKIELFGDADFFSVGLAGNTAYTVTTSGISTSITVYRPDGTQLTTGGSPRSFTSVAGGGTHHVRIQGSSGAGSYTVTVQ